MENKKTILPMDPERKLGPSIFGNPVARQIRMTMPLWNLGLQKKDTVWYKADEEVNLEGATKADFKDGYGIVVFPEPLTEIKADFIGEGTNIEALWIPRSITKIAEDAFKGVKKLYYTGADAEGTPWGAGSAEKRYVGGIGERI